MKYPFRLAKQAIPCFLLHYLLLVPGNETSAQQPLNLDFEKTGSGHPSMPWGWEYEPVSGMKASLDSSVKKQGMYSLFLEGDDKNDLSLTQSLNFYFEPYGLLSKKITVDGWCRTEKLSGSILIRLEQNRDSANETATSSQFVQMNGNTHVWERFAFTLQILPKVNWIRLQIIHSGAGRAWLDQLVLSSGKKRIKSLAVAPAFTPSQMNWLYNATQPIRGVDARSPIAEPDDKDLESFKRIAGDAQIIALGEATHGTSEFFRLKHRVLEYAVKEMGVRVFAIEDHQLIAEKVNQYVLSGNGDLRKSMTGMFGVWDNQEVVNLIKWVRDYNAVHPDDKVEFLGFDMQMAGPPLDSLFNFLGAKDTVLLNNVSGLLEGLKNNWMTMYLVSDSLKQEWKKNATVVFEKVFAQKNKWLSHARSLADTVLVEWAVQYARLIKQFAEENINPMGLYRDKAMADNISWILSQRRPGTRMLIWAHDVHISRGEYPDNSYNYHRGISMGSWLAKKYGGLYKAFGISTYTGGYRAFPGYTDYSKWITCPAFPAPVGSLDEALHQICLKRRSAALLLNLQQAKKQDWFVKPLPVRFANHVCYEYAYWTRFVIPFQFDGIFFADTTSAAKPYRAN